MSPGLSRLLLAQLRTSCRSTLTGGECQERTSPSRHHRKQVYVVGSVAKWACPIGPQREETFRASSPTVSKVLDLALGAGHSTAVGSLPLRTSSTIWFHSAWRNRTMLSGSPILTSLASITTSEQAPHSGQRLALICSIALSPRSFLRYTR
jgi:hypothetical protein